MKKNALYSIELVSPSENEIEKVEKVVRQLALKPYVLYIVPYEEMFGQSETQMEKIELATNFLKEIGNRLLIPIPNRFFEVGESRIIIPRVIRSNNIDLLIFANNKKNILTSLTYDLLINTRSDVLLLN